MLPVNFVLFFYVLTTQMKFHIPLIYMGDAYTSGTKIINQCQFWVNWPLKYKENGLYRTTWFCWDSAAFVSVCYLTAVFGFLRLKLTLLWSCCWSWKWITNRWQVRTTRQAVRPQKTLLPLITGQQQMALMKTQLTRGTLPPQTPREWIMTNS